MKRTLIIITSCLLLSVVLVVVLYALSNHMIHQHGSFLRIFPPHPVAEKNMLDIKYNSYYIAGVTDDHIYLGNITAPLHLLITNRTLTDTQHVRLSIENMENIKFKNPQLSVNPPYFYLMDGNLPGLFRGKVGEWNADRFMYDSAYFTDIVPMGPSSFALRSLNSRTQEHMLGKEIANIPYVHFKTNLLEKQIDGIFCTDGMLHYNKELSQLVYLYYYRNQYLVMDTNLNLLYKGNTIDTNYQAKIKIANIPSNNSRTMSAPPLMVNGESCVSGDWLLVNSKLMSKNEDAERFERASVIDVYDLQSRQYKFSFYLYDRDEKKVRSFQVFKNTLIALYDHHIVTYKLNDQHFGKENKNT